MAWIDGEDQGTSSVTKSLARHKMKHASDATRKPGGEQAGEGHEVTITKMPGGGFHTKSTHHDGSVTEADHQTYEEAAAHGASHLGHAKPMREKNPKMREKEEPPMDVEADHGAGGGLATMGVDGE
jgi:hypothetical protein